ncbi:histone deacetylase family protein [Leptospira ilyithenensis]|uniref:Histone deacetylase n=1 Tax=Leptospira ilyithenensis TaxID=2484901 RepID=A0A4R9LLC9_9LEPT|nr:histone deacetylase [Leptospira ilyithenensis]TGN07055.1 histone deacetylase [Leptospira ilyithenensis]
MTDSRAKTAIAFCDEFLKHDTGIGHPETKGRLESILAKLQNLPSSKFLWQKEITAASPEQIGLAHDLNYIRSFKDASTTHSFGYFDADTPFSSVSYRAATLAAGAGIHLADRILANEIQNGFALVRPPGHHAESTHAMGFCFFNNVAITAKYLQSKGIKRILILDWDVHHGNGTQHQFYEDDSVYFISFHQYPFYPGTGAASERGSGKGKGFTLNFPLPRSSEEYDYLKLWPGLQKEMESFQPEFVLISAGFDAHKNDPLGGMQLSTSSFETFTVKILEEAKLYAKGRVLSFLEGGYDFTALAESVNVHLQALAG